MATAASAEERLVSTSRGPKFETRSLKTNKDAPGARNIVFVAEGYKASEKEEYFRDCVAALDAVAKMPAWRTIEENAKPNFHFVFVPSLQTGSGPEPGNSAFHLSYYSDGQGAELLKADEFKASLAAAVFAKGRLDVAVVFGKLKSMPESLRAHAKFSGIVVLASSAPEALPHELGHALYGLGDEYAEHENESVTLPVMAKFATERRPNLSTSPNGKPQWHHFDAPVVEGGGSYGKGVYRPFPHCAMREARTSDFCPVCTAAIRAAAGKNMLPPTIVRLGFTTSPGLRSSADVFANYFPRQDNETSRVAGTWMSTAKTTRPL